MSRYHDNSNVPHTCPKIDEVISAIKSVEWTDEDYWDEKGLVDIMEDIRKSKVSEILFTSGFGKNYRT